MPVLLVTVPLARFKLVMGAIGVVGVVGVVGIVGSVGGAGGVTGIGSVVPPPPTQALKVSAARGRVNTKRRVDWRRETRTCVAGVLTVKKGPPLLDLAWNADAILKVKVDSSGGGADYNL